jgi:hypothetical protein
MKSELLAGVIAVMLSIPALAATQASTTPQAAGSSRATPVAAPAPTLPVLGNAPYVAFSLAEPNGWAALDLNAPVTRVVTIPPPATTTEGDDEVEPASSPPMETSTYALILAGLAVLLYIGSRLRRD